MLKINNLADYEAILQINEPNPSATLSVVYTSNAQTVQPSTTNQQESQMHAVRKIHNLLSSGAVTVTGPNQPRILKAQPKFQTNSGVVQVVQTSVHNSQQPQQFIVQHQTQIQQPQVISSRCYVCDDPAGNTGTILNDAVTSSSSTKFPNKIGQIIGDSFMVIISVDDVLCKRCTTMINHLDRLENDIERVKQNVLNMLNKKYSLSEDGNGVTSPPPLKLQKLNSGIGNTITRKLNEDDVVSNSITRKITVQTNRDPIENQLSSLFESSPESAKQNHPPQQGPVQQMKIISPQLRQQLAQEQKKGPIKIYKCMSCDFKTTDLKQFQPHYETCKQQNGFNCKTCKRMFSTMTALKQHIAEKHPTEYTCNICSSNFLNEMALKKHLEINHPDIKPVNEPVCTQLFTCNMCSFVSSDKAYYEEHTKKHAKLKPFKCRLCSTRFETREQANIHAKSHQANYFKCGTCSAQFPEKEMLVKHFEIHESKTALPSSGIQQQLQQKSQMIQKIQPVQQLKPVQQQPPTVTTQKLLQETIDEALRETDNLDSKGGIHFFSCNICSLTFIQETYYNQHMETHKQENKKPTILTNNTGTGTVVSVSSFTNSGGNSGISSIARQDISKSNNFLSTTASSGAQNTTTTGNNNQISEADIESIFEKLHSDKSENEVPKTTVNVSETVPATTTASTTSENFVITSQENAIGSITFNVTIPKDSTITGSKSDDKSNTENITVGISMPVLDQPEEENDKLAKSQQENNGKTNSTESSAEKDDKNDKTNIPTGPVSMPSLDDDGLDPTTIASTNTTTTTSITTRNQTNLSETTKSLDSDEQKQTENLQNDEQQQQQQQQEHQEHQDQQSHDINSDQVAMELDDMHNAEGSQIKFILNENGQLLQLDNHILTTDSEGNQILVQGTDPEQIQQLLQSVGVLHGDGLDGETLQMIQGENNQMIIVQGDEGPQLIDASLLNADGHIVIQQHADGDLGEGGHHAIGEDGVQIPVSVSYTVDGQQVVTAHHTGENQGNESEDQVTTGETTITTQSLTTAQASGGGSTESGETFFALEDLMQQPEQKSGE